LAAFGQAHVIPGRAINHRVERINHRVERKEDTYRLRRKRAAANRRKVFFDQPAPRGT
jgi:hypothetical protein